MSCELEYISTSVLGALHILIREMHRYHSIRIDSVHYCDREVELAAQRRRRSSSGRHESPPQERLQLLSRTVRENPFLAQKLHFLKIPYMTREGSVADLARTISFAPNLLYVDLPDSAYTDDPSSSMLKMELQSRCPRIRHMRYLHGSEASFQALAYTGHWTDLEALELSDLAVEVTTIIDVVVSLTALRNIKLVNMALLDDSLFDVGLRAVSFPPLVKFHLQGISNISIQGLVTYLSKQETKDTIKQLLLVDTDVPTSEVHQILSANPNLESLHVVSSVSRALPVSRVPRLASPSLRVLHYEISGHSTSPSVPPSPSESYYAYLSDSILYGSLPTLSHLYAFSDTPQKLLQLAPGQSHPTNGMGAEPPPLSLGIAKPFLLYTKAVREMEWNVTLILPPSTTNRRGRTTATRPESLCFAAPLSPQYRNDGRSSVVVGNGFGGFLTVPSPSFPPGSPHYKNKKKDMNAWMG